MEYGDPKYIHYEVKRLTPGGVARIRDYNVRSWLKMGLDVVLWYRGLHRILTNPRGLEEELFPWARGKVFRTQLLNGIDNYKLFGYQYLEKEKEIKEETLPFKNRQLKLF